MNQLRKKSKSIISDSTKTQDNTLQSINQRLETKINTELTSSFTDINAEMCSEYLKMKKRGKKYDS